MLQPLGAGSARHFLFLEGPYGSFFRRLGERLAAEGHGVERINFNGGDRHDWGRGGHDFTGGAEDWPIFVDAFLDRHAITDVILYGDCRPLHRAARGIARLRGCRIHVFEEGYIRPDFLTLEQGGVNGNSSLSSDPAWYLAEAAALPPAAELPAVSGSFERRVRDALAYQLASAAARVRFRRYRPHRPYGPAAEAVGWLRKWARRPADRRRSAATLGEIGNRPFFCFPLQLSSDHQIRSHSPFPDMPVAIAYVIRSFARFAPAGTLLVLKQHPLHADLINYPRLIEAEAARAGVPDRVHYVEDADIDVMVARALGVVTVNSTTGTLALRHGTPTVVLGHAVYNIPRITFQGSLDAFWSCPVPPEPAVFDAFCRVLLDRCLVHGGYHSESGLRELVEQSVARLGARAQGASAAGVGGKSAGR